MNNEKNRTNKPSDDKKKITVILDDEQMELLEKLSVFYGSEEEKAPAGRIVENAVKSYTSEQVRFIVSRYAIDIRGIPLTEMREYRHEVCVNIASRDTIVLPLIECRENRTAVFERRSLETAHIDRAKLPHLNYVAFYWNTPLCGISHYAKIVSIEPCPSDVGKVLINFDTPEELPECIHAKDQQYRVKRPKYTMLTILLEAKVLEDLF
ncbi:MAG: hypothetical protein LBV27_10425 [Oscillospiraceae bacterium]|jgi:hypothetical protein|nr:hypothetical protein [Oscillospiraceae bacterium]